MRKEGIKVKFSFHIFVYFLFFAGNIFAQNLDNLAERIKNGSTEEKRDAIYQIKLIKTPETSQIAVFALRDSNEIVRANAAQSIVYLPAEEVLTFLSPLLRDKSVLVRKETVYALGKTKNPNAVQLFLNTFQREKNIEVKSAITMSLGEIGDISAVNSLLNLLKNKPKDNEIFLRRAIVRSIGQIAQFQQVGNNYIVTPESFLPDKYNDLVNLKYTNLTERFQVYNQVIPVLVSILQNSKESDDVKREAAFALGTIGNISALSSLQSSLNSNDYYLVKICQEAIQKIKSAN